MGAAVNVAIDSYIVESRGQKMDTYTKEIIKQLFPHGTYATHQPEPTRSDEDQKLIVHLIESLVEAQAKIENIMALPHRCCDEDDCYFDERPIYDLFRWIEKINGDL